MSQAADVVAPLPMQLNYVNSYKYARTRVYVCIEVILIIVSYAKTL